MAGIPFKLRDGAQGKRLPAAPKAGKVDLYFDAAEEPQILRSDGTTRKLRTSLTTELTDAGDMSRQSSEAVALTGGTADSLTITGGSVGGAATVQTTGKQGYTTGAGGTVSQTSNKGNAVTLNALNGEITMNSAELAADTPVSFTLNNSTIEAGDHIDVWHLSGGTRGNYAAGGAVTGAGTASLWIRNLTTGPLSNSVVLKFKVNKGSTS